MTERRVLGARNPRIAELRRLLGRRSSRGAGEPFVVEGVRTLVEVLDAGLTVATVIVPTGAVADDLAAVLDRLADATELLEVPDHVFERMAPSTTPQPVLAIAERPATEIPAHADATTVVIVLAGVGDPGNVGTLVRVADAIGATAVVVAGGADPWSPKAVRASAGSVCRVPVIDGLPPDVALDRLRAAGLVTVGAAARRGAPHDEADLDGPVAIVLGSEPHGIDPALEPLIDRWVHIAMPGRTESLNVAMAGTLLAFEARRRP